MIIVSGKIYIRSGQRDLFLQSSLQAMAEARQTQGCLDFVVSPDPIEPHRVNVYEEWDSQSALEAFRGSGPASDLTALIVNANVREHQVISHKAG